MADVTAATITGSGSAFVPLPDGRAGNLMELIVAADQDPPIAAPSGWDDALQFRLFAPILRTFQRTREVGDSGVLVTVGADAAILLIDYGTTPERLFATTSSGSPANPLTFSHTDGGQQVLTIWHTANAFIDTAGDFERLALASSGGMSLSAYLSDDTPESGTFEDTVGTLRWYLARSYSRRTRWWAGTAGSG